jgi:hypothetical protein
VIDRRRLIAVFVIALVAGVLTLTGFSRRPSVASADSLCTSPSYSSSNASATDNTDPGSGENWWVNNDAWSGTHGPQTINVCSNSSWYATSTQPNDGDQVETYPDTEYDVGGREHQSTIPISGWNSITSTFDESDPMNGGDSWDAAYDLWTDNWKHETMIWNQWAGGQGYWADCANGAHNCPSGGDPQALMLGGVPYHFFANGAELMFFRDNQVSSGSVDILAAYQWEVAHGFASAGDIPTQIEYGTEISYTTGQETFNVTGLSVNLVPKGGTNHGYWLVGSDGGIFNYGLASFEGSTGSLKLQRPVVGITRTPGNNGYWLVASDGGVFAFNAPFVGSLPGLGLHPAGSGLPHSLDQPVVGMVPSASGQGYYMVAADGGVFAFNSTFAGSCPGIGGCSGAAVAVAPDATGDGYWLATSTGHVYSFGDAPYFGAPGPQSSPITSMVRTSDGGGYYLLDADGQVFAYGDAQYLGALIPGAAGGIDPATAIFDTDDGGGYWISTALGKVYPYGDAPADGDMSGTHLNGPIVAATGF